MGGGTDFPVRENGQAKVCLGFQTPKTEKGMPFSSLVSFLWATQNLRPLQLLLLWDAPLKSGTTLTPKP